MSDHLEFEQWVRFPIERVFAFLSNPENLRHIMPASSQTKLIVLNRMPAPPPPAGFASDKAAGVGSAIVTSFRLFPFCQCAQWVARITEFEWNHHFADVQEKGRLKAGITATNSARKRAMALPGRRCGTGLNTKSASGFWIRLRTRSSSAARCGAPSPSANESCRNFWRSGARPRKAALQLRLGRPSAVRGGARPSTCL
jgi:hypothetical protein